MPNIQKLNVDEAVKSPFCPIFVIPSMLKTGIHPAEGGTAFAGVRAFLTFYEIINLGKFRFSGLHPNVFMGTTTDSALRGLHGIELLKGPGADGVFEQPDKGGLKDEGNGES